MAANSPKGIECYRAGIDNNVSDAIKFAKIASCVVFAYIACKTGVAGYLVENTVATTLDGLNTGR